MELFASCGELHGVWSPKEPKLKWRGRPACDSLRQQIATSPRGGEKHAKTVEERAEA
jgi:hypothetical protein